MARQTRNNRYSRKIRRQRKRPRRKRTYRKRRKRTRRRRGGDLYDDKFIKRAKKTLPDYLKILDREWKKKGGAENIRLGLCSTTSKKWNKYWRHTFRRGRHLPTYIKIRQCRQKYVKLFEKLFPEKYLALSEKIAYDREVKKMEPPNSKEKKRETRQRRAASRRSACASWRNADRIGPLRVRQKIDYFFL